MNKISISHSHNYDKTTACEKAESMLEDIAQDYNLDIETDGDGSITFNGSGISGDVVICHNKVTLNATLNFLMVPMKSVISTAIQEKLDKKFS
ncbi:MAG: polyhydroxyalkanoic acid system family protein [Proteobacteria bacterium]|nr:polyhydroxyalkanoic acid system family protein [Pseudomonadota bacterium]